MALTVTPTASCRIGFFLIAFLLLSILMTNAADAEPPELNATLISSTFPALGAIDHEAFSRSIPSRMIVGQTYRVVVIITNTGNASGDFFVEIVFPSKYALRYFYSNEVWKPTKLTLDPGSSQRIEFPLTPLVEYVGALEIEARVYSVLPGLEPTDRVSKAVHEIRTVLPRNLLSWAIGLSLLAAFLLITVRVLKKTSERLDFLIAILLFIAAFLPRLSLATRASLHIDEGGLFWAGALRFLNNDWKWPIEYTVSGYPPLFFYLLAGFIFLFGNSIMAIRTISILSGSLAVVVQYFLAKSLFCRKVALASSLFLGFASYHILYSGTATSDSSVILLILSFAYFFWIGWKRNVWKYYALSGFLLGLAFDVKYVVIAVVPAVILFILWIKKSLRSLFDWKLLVLGASFLVTILPVQYTYLISEFNPIISYLQVAFSSAVLLPTKSFNPIIEYIPRGFRVFLYSMARAASPWLPWLAAFEAAVYISLFITIVYHAYAALKGQPSESFVLFFMASMLLLLIDPVKHFKWLLYSAPFFFIMLSNMMIRYIDDIRSRISGSTKYRSIDLFRIFALLFAFIFAFSGLLVGIVAPFVDQGEFAGLSPSMLFIKNRARPNDIVAGFHVEIAAYYINLYDIQVAYISLAMRPETEELLSRGVDILKEIKLNGQLLILLKPRFILENRMEFNHYYNITIKKWIFENYDLVSSSRPFLGYSWTGTEYQEWLVFERKD